jgi:hypothetical protein
MKDYESHDTELAPGAIVDCPSCGLPAEITDRFTLAGAPGPVEHVKVVCVRRHWYTLPTDMFPVSTPFAKVPLGVTRGHDLPAQ